MMHICEVCAKPFTNKGNMVRHAKTHGVGNKQSCPICVFATSRPDHMKRHMEGRHYGVEPVMPKPVVSTSAVVPLGEPMSDVESVMPPAEPLEDAEDRKPAVSIETILQINRRRIDDYERVTNRYQDLYNFEVRNPTPQKIEEFVRSIFRKQDYAFRLNLSFGYVLYNNISGEHEFFYASNNNRMLPRPVTISCQNDIADFMAKIDTTDIVEFCKQQRSNSRFVVERVTNVLFYVNRLKNFYIGCPDVELPEFIIRKQSVIALVSDTKNQKRYKDNLCLFRCISYRLNGSRYEWQVKMLAESYCKRQGLNLKTFKGVPLSKIPMVEDQFQINIPVYSLGQEKTADGEMTVVVARKVQESRRMYADTVNVNLYENHFSYIKDMNKYASRWKCSKCGKLFGKRNHATVHQRHCLASTRFEYGNGGYGQPKSLFDRLRENGYMVEDDLQYYEYVAAYDLECFKDEQKVKEGAKLRFTHRMVPASVSVSSNVPGFEQPKCFVSTGDPEGMIASMYAYMVAISEKSYQLLTIKYAGVISWLDEKREHTRCLQREVDDDTACPQRQVALKNEIYRCETYDLLAAELDLWLRRIPMLGFNSGRFDICLIRQYLFPFMLKQKLKVEDIIKKGCEYLCITTDHFQFMDVKNYISPGTSYAQWLKANEVTTQKGFWPYDWFVSLDQLKQTQLMEKECFWSELKQAGISEEDYAYLQEVWVREKFQSVKDLLVWYNNLDTAPFIEAAKKTMCMWRGLGLDPFKGNCISLPGLSLRLLVKKMQKHTILPLIKEGGLFDLIKKNIVGGLSVVIHRYHEVGVTVLPSGEPVARIFSHDCNALYLWALGEKMGTGIYAVWTPQASEGVTSMPWVRGDDRDKIMRWHDVRQTNQEVLFHREISYKHAASQLEWLEWTAHMTGIQIEHKFNGREKVIRVSPTVHYPVDGYDPASNTLYQFHGCYWHGHGCQVDSEKDGDQRAVRREATRTVDQTIRQLGYNVCTMWECEWLQQKRQDHTIGQFAEEHLNLPTKTKLLTAAEILRRVENDEFFGLLEVDLECPWWHAELLQWYADFPPIYKNTEVSIDQIGDFMRQYAEDNGLLAKPRRCLINSYFGRKLLISSSLLRWYLQLGVVVTRVYKVIEMKGKRCFQDLREEIANHRRRGDRDPRFAPMGAQWKLVGNSLYGKTVTDKDKHKSTKLVLDENVAAFINSKRFCKMEEVSDTSYEVSLDKKKIKQDLPITVGFCVYNAAKLNVLEFIYGFLKRYLRDGSYQLIASDTDSVIAAYADPNLDNLVKPEMMGEYLMEGKRKFLVVDDHDLREPGKYKVEMEATGMVALCSKTYLAWNDDDKSTNASTKGLSKRTNNFKKEDFMHVLRTGEPGGGVNHGLRMHGKDMCQYVQEKSGLSYLYIKRQVLDDGVTTTPLEC